MNATLPETPAGWALGTDCGYPNHSGFVRAAGNGHWSLYPARDGERWTLALIRNGIAVSGRQLSFQEALDYVGGAGD